jgi:hypothetical protein
MGINFVPSTSVIIGLRFNAAAGCVIGASGVLFRGLSAVSSSMPVLSVVDARLVFDNADVRGPIRLAAASVQGSAVAVRNTTVSLPDCSVATTWSGAAAVTGVGIASPNGVSSSTVEVTDSVVSCDGPSSYSAKVALSTVGIVGVAAGSYANDVTVIFTNATVTSVGGFDWTQASSTSHTLVGLAGIAAMSNTASSVIARRSTFRTANIVGATVGRLVVGVGVAGVNVGSGSQITVTAVDGTSVWACNVSFSSAVGRVVGGIGIVLDTAAALAVAPSISISLNNATVTVENSDYVAPSAAVPGIGLAMGSLTLNDANISVASTSVTVSNFSSLNGIAQVVGVGAALYYGVILGDLNVAVSRGSVIAIRDCPRPGTQTNGGVGGVGTAQNYGAATIVSITVSDSDVSLRDSWIASGVAGVGAFRYHASAVTGDRLVDVRVTRSTIYVRKGFSHTDTALVHGVGITGDSNSLENTTSLFVVAVNASSVVINNTGASDSSRTTVGAVGVAGYGPYMTFANISAVNSNLYVSDVGPTAASAAVGLCGIAVDTLPAIMGGSRWNVNVRGGSLTYARTTPYTAATASSTKLIRGVGCVTGSVPSGRLVAAAISVTEATVTDVVAGNASAAPIAAGCPLVGAALGSSPNSTEIVLSGGAALRCVGTCVGLLLAGTSSFPAVIDVAASSLFQCQFALPLILWYSATPLSPSAASSSRVALTNSTAFARPPLSLSMAMMTPIIPTVSGPDGGDMLRLCSARTAFVGTTLTPTLSTECAPTTASASTAVTLTVPGTPSRTGSISSSGDCDADTLLMTVRTSAKSSSRDDDDDGRTSLTADRGTVTESTAWSVTRTASLAAHPRSTTMSHSGTWNGSYSPSLPRGGHVPSATATHTATMSHERSITLLPPPVAPSSAPTLLSPSAANAVSGAANGAAAVVSIVGAMPGAAAQAAMAQAAITMSECSDTVPETPLTFPQSLAPGFSVGRPRAGHYRGAMVASFASLGMGGALLLAAGYVLQRVRPQTAEGENDVFLRSLTAVMAPGTMFTIVAFNVDPVVGAATALLQVGEDYAMDAPVAVCGTALLALCMAYVWRAVRRATDPRDAAWCLRFDPVARVVPPFKRPPFGLSCLTPVVLRWCFYGTGAWVDANFDAAGAADFGADAAWKPPSVSAAGRRLRVVIGSLRSDFGDEAVDHDRRVGLYARAVVEPPQISPRRRSVLDVLLPATQEYVFFALGCTAATSILRASRFDCAAQLWLLAFVQCFTLIFLLARKPYTVSAKNVLSIVSASLTGAAFVCLALDASTSVGHASVKALGQSLAAIAALMSYPTLAITLGRRLLLLYWYRRASQAADTADAVDVDDCLVEAALLGHRIFDDPAPFDAASPPPVDVDLGLVAAPDSISESTGTASGSANRPCLGDVVLDKDENDVDVDGMRFTRHAQDGDDQVDWTRLNPLRRATKLHAGVSQADDFSSAVDNAEASRRRAALAAMAAVDDADAVLLL